MIQRPCGSCMPSETLDRTSIVSEVGREELERNLATERQILGEEHDTHSAAAQRGMDAIATARARTPLRSTRACRSASDISGSVPDHTFTRREHTLESRF